MGIPVFCAGLVLILYSTQRMFLQLAEQHDVWRVLLDPHIVLHYLGHEWKTAAVPFSLNLTGIVLVALGYWLGGPII